MNYSSHDIADILERLDHTDIGSSEEALSVALLRVCFEQIPGLSQALLGGLLVDRWWPGGHFHGDLVARDSQHRVIAHLEIKGRGTQPNWPKKPCKRATCLGRNVQFEHMLEDGAPIILLTSPGARSLRDLNRDSPGTLAQLRVMHWEEVATSLRSLTPVHFDPLKAMLGV